MSNQAQINAIPESYTLAAKRILAAFLQEFFQNREDYPYIHGDELRTAINIHDKHAFNLEAVGDKPALVIDRKQFRWLNTSIDKNLGSFGLTAAQLKMDLVQGTIICHCLARKGLVAEALAHIVFFGIESMRQVIRRMGVWEVAPVGVGEESIIVTGPDTEITSVPVIINVTMQGKWLTRNASSRLVEDTKVEIETQTLP